jgi:uncharacterized membrane protein YkvA (DUF1232 family)
MTSSAQQAELLAGWSGPLQIAAAVGLAFLVVWIVLVVSLFRASPPKDRLKEALRLLPDVVRLVKRLASDRELPSGVRVRLGLVLVYLVLPFDLVPDFIPVLGQADDVVVVLLALRSVVRRAGPEAVRKHWPGTEAGLAVIWRAAGLPGSAEGETARAT